MTPYSYRSDPAVPGFPDDRPLIIFDGECVLCSASVRFILRHDRHRRFRLLTAQSALGQALYAHYGLNRRELETNVLIHQGLAWFESEGAIRMAGLLGFPYSLASAARLLPLRWRDALYAWIARNRYRWFGRNTVCHLPAPSERERFLE